MASSTTFSSPCNVRAAGYRVVYDPEAIAWEEVAPNARHEFRRRRADRGRQFPGAASHLAPCSIRGPAPWRCRSGRTRCAAGWCLFSWLGAQLSAALLAREPLYGVAAALGGVLVLLALLGHRLDLRARLLGAGKHPLSLPVDEPRAPSRVDRLRSRDAVDRLDANRPDGCAPLDAPRTRPVRTGARRSRPIRVAARVAPQHVAETL